jgi:hypothetical protein
VNIGREGRPVRVRGLTWLILVTATMALLSMTGHILGLYTDWLWFRDAQFTSVFVTVLQTQVLLGVVTGAAFFLILYGNVTLARRLAPREALVAAEDAPGLPSPEILEPYLRRLALPVSVTLALLAGWLGTDRWELVLKALNPTPFDIRDPLFDQDAAFYVFRLPLWNSLYGWLMRVLVLSGLAATAVYFGTRGIQVSPGAVSISRRARGHLLALAALLLLLKAAGYRLAMFDLLFSQRGVAFGAGYADVHAQLPVLKALMLLAGLVAVLCFVTIRLRSWRPLLWSVAALVGVGILGGVAYPGLIQRYQVSPNEIVKEKPYIDFNIRYTRLAYGLDNIEEREFPAEETLTLQDLRKNEATLKNIRLWDTRPLLATYSQLQEIRTYYKFTDIDIDRYLINGEYRQVTLSPRELSAKDLPSRIWINERVDVYARLRRRGQSGEPGDARGAPRVLDQGHPPGGLHRSPNLPPGALLQRTGHGLCLREDPGQGVRLPGGGPERLHRVRGAGRDSLGVRLAQDAVRGASGGSQAPPVERSDH